MIIDLQQHWSRYFPGEGLACVGAFLSTLSSETADREYPLVGKDIFARVMSYETRSPEKARLESHRDYVDVQASIRGAEGIEWFPVEGLTVETPYDSAADVTFYRRPAPAPARVDVVPGSFVVLFPWDAHMPQLAVEGAPEMVKKVVVKIRRRIFWEG